MPEFQEHFIQVFNAVLTDRNLPALFSKTCCLLIRWW